MADNGVTFSNLAVKTAEWNKTYGSDEFWPQDCYVINFFLEDRMSSDFDHVYPIFLNEEKKTKEEILAIAADAFRKAAEPEQGAAWMDSIWSYANLWSDGYDYNAVNETYGCPVWWVEFSTGTGDDRHSCGYAQLDEDGNVLDVQFEMSNG